MLNFYQKRTLSNTIRLMTILYMLCICQLAIAQTKNFQGVVKDAKGNTLPGVTILETGTSNGVSTNIDGIFEIKLRPGSTLTVSYIGYITRTIPTNDKTTFLNIILEEDVFQLDDVVVVGYGSMKKGEVTSAITSVKKDDFLAGMVKSPEQLLQGKVAGLQLSNYTGDPVLGLEMTIRGVNSLSGNTSPLIVIDGIPGGSLTAISSEDIESIDVLKDGSAAAIYGTRGTNGVIVITTNRAKATKLSMEYNGSISFETFAKHADMLTANDYRRLTDDPDFPGIQDEGTTTDWVDAISRTAISHNHFLSLKGGSAESNYVASIDYRKREGVIRHTDRESITAKIGLNHNMFNNKLRFQFNINDSYVTQQRAWYAAYLNALLENPTRPIYDENGNYTEYKVNNRTNELYNVGGTDLGIVWELQPGHYGFFFGDTFGSDFYPNFVNPGPNGSNWRSNVLLFSDDQDLSDGLTINGAAMDESGKNAREICYGGKDGSGNGDWTSIPTAAIRANGIDYVHYMNIRNWAGWITNFSSLYKSSDNGITWTRCQNVKFGSTSNFGQVSYFKKDGYIYMVGTITGRDNKPHLARFLEENIENQTEYEFWNGSGWIKGNETAATPLFNDISGELSIAYHPEFKKWILLYFNSTRYDISFRTADHIIGEWSKPQKLVDGWQYSQLYGSYIHPISLKGNILYFIMSMWLPYNTYLMSAELKCNL